MCAMGFNDSKQLDEKAREGLFKRMLRTPRLGWSVLAAIYVCTCVYVCLCVCMCLVSHDPPFHPTPHPPTHTATNQTHRVIHSLTAAEISGGMLRREPYSLNALSHDTAADLISLVLVRCFLVGGRCRCDGWGFVCPWAVSWGARKESHDAHTTTQTSHTSIHPPTAQHTHASKTTHTSIQPPPK